jgi:hypothetical protein
VQVGDDQRTHRKRSGTRWCGVRDRRDCAAMLALPARARSLLGWPGGAVRNLERLDRLSGLRTFSTKERR